LLHDASQYKAGPDNRPAGKSYEALELGSFLGSDMDDSVVLGGETSVLAGDASVFGAVADSVVVVDGVVSTESLFDFPFTPLYPSLYQPAPFK